MGIHQADLHGSKKDQERLDGVAMRAYLEGEGELSSGLALEPELIDKLRRQALALMATGKWQRCIDVLLALAALGSIHPADPIMLGRCHRELGQLDVAEACADHAERMLHAMGLEIPPALVELDGRTT
jgi:hypothetical protein